MLLILQELTCAQFKAQSVHEHACSNFLEFRKLFYLFIFFIKHKQWLIQRFLTKQVEQYECSCNLISGPVFGALLWQQSLINCSASDHNEETDDFTFLYACFS